jgi:hypothetical protein
VKAVHKKRLLKLAAHLRGGKLGHERFDFRYINADDEGRELNHNGCGSVGCALGECPIAFPRLWKFRSGKPRLIRLRPFDGDWQNETFQSARRFFGISDDEARHLFQPDAQIPEWGGRHLGNFATRKQVASNIEAFVKRKEKESKC